LHRVPFQYVQPSAGMLVLEHIGELLRAPSSCPTALTIATPPAIAGRPRSLLLDKPASNGSGTQRTASLSATIAPW